MQILKTGLARGGLRAKIVAWFLIPTVVILSTVALLTFYAYRRVTEDLVFERNQDRTELLANQWAAELVGYANALDAFASTEEVLTGHPTLQQAALWQEWPIGDLQVFDGGALILDRQGIVAAAVPDSPDLLGRDLSKLTPPRPGVDGEAIGFTNVLTGAIPGMDAIALSRPILDPEGELLGTAVGLFRAERGATRTSQFYRDIWTLYIGRRETAFLVDGHGRVIFHPDTFFIGEDFSGQEAVGRALRGRSGVVRTADLEGREVVAGFTPVPDTPWSLITEERWADLIRPSQPYTRFLLALLALGVVVPVVVVALGVRRVTGPIGRLTTAAGRIAAGNFGQTIEVQTGDELETLAEQFNSMAAQLKASYATLEQRVADRTRELATLNAISAVVSRSLELEEIMAAALAKVLETMQMEAGAAFRLERSEEESTLILMAHDGLPDALVRQIESLPLRSSVAARAVSGGAPIAQPVADYAEGTLKTLLQEEGFRSVVSIPLVARDQILGVLNLATHAPRAIMPAERSLLAAIGQQVGVAVENARLYEQAEMAAAAAERNRLARELHDAVSQTLFSASLIADVLPRLWKRDPAEAERQLEALRLLTRGALAEMRTLLLELRPAALLKAELPDLLRQLGQAIAGRAQIEIDIDCDLAGAPLPEPPPEVKVALYRIAQEALNNVVKHAGAGRVTLSLQWRPGSALELRIGDDGRGFDPGEVSADHFGLANMRERAEAVGASLKIESQIGRGTEVIVLWGNREEA